MNVDRPIGEVLFTEAMISARVAELGRAISAYYRRKDLVLVTLLKGGVFFASDLVRRLDIPTSMEFLRYSSYRGETTPLGVPRRIGPIPPDIQGRDVLLVDDIVDTGATLVRAIEEVRAEQPASLRVAVLLKKEARRVEGAQIDWYGFAIPDRFVVGYGLDYREHYRSLPYVAVLADA